MKELLIKVIIDNEKISTGFKHRGFSAGDYTIEQILLTVGILENLKQQMIEKLKTKGIISS